MSNTVKIGTDERSIEEAGAQWINQQINRRRDNGENVCVVVRINRSGVSITLTTPSCGSGAGAGGRKPNYKEAAVLELWADRGMNQIGFNGGNLVSFLAQLDHLL